MKTLIVGLGVQGRKRMAAAGRDVAGTVDPVVQQAQYKHLEDVPLEMFDAALVCTPDQAKLELLGYLLSHQKHVLVEKPLLAKDEADLLRLDRLADRSGVTCYTAYNHRFEPHVERLKALLEAGGLGRLYVARMFYGNGTARNVRASSWRDQGFGVLADLGSHLLDLVQWLFGFQERTFVAWSAHRFENRAYDHASFGATGEPVCELGVSLVSWKNTFTIDVVGERGSAHVQGLCKWGPSTLTVRRRVLPSGAPREEVTSLECADPTWEREYQYFKTLCLSGGTTLRNDLWINGALTAMARAMGMDASVDHAESFLAGASRVTSLRGAHDTSES